MKKDSKLHFKLTDGGDVAFTLHDRGSQWALEVKVSTPIGELGSGQQLMESTVISCVIPNSHVEAVAKAIARYGNMAALLRMQGLGRAVDVANWFAGVVKGS